MLITPKNDMSGMMDNHGSMRIWNSTYNKSCQSIHLIIEFKEMSIMQV